MSVVEGASGPRKPSKNNSEDEEMLDISINARSQSPKSFCDEALKFSSKQEFANKESNNRQQKNEMEEKFIFEYTDNAPYQVYIESTDKNVGQLKDMALGKLFIRNKIEGIIKIEKRGKNRVSVLFKTYIMANNFLQSSFDKENNFKSFIPKHLIFSKGIIRQVDKEISEETILRDLCTDNNRKVVEVKRIKRKIVNEEDINQSSYIDTASVIITFRGKNLPKYAYLYYNARPVDIYIPPVIQCFKCCRYGHTKTQCRSDFRCPACSENHDINTCKYKNSPICAFCKEKHFSNEQGTPLSKRICPEFSKQKKIKSLMASYNYTYFEASSLCQGSSHTSNIPIKLNDDSVYPLLNKNDIISYDQPIMRMSCNSTQNNKNNFTYSKAVSPAKRPLTSKSNFHNNLLNSPNGRSSEEPSKRPCFNYPPTKSPETGIADLITSLKSVYESNPRNISNILKAIFPTQLHNNFLWLDNIHKEKALIH